MRTALTALLAISGLFSQTPTLQFEVATIRRVELSVDGQPATVGIRIDGAQFRASRMSLRDLVALAYKTGAYQLDVPQWMFEQRYDVSGTLPEGHDKMDEVREMLQVLLAERFHMKVHRATRDISAYVLVQALRRTALAGTELAQAQVGTIRLKLFKVAARVAVTVRRVVFHLSSSYPYQEIFRTVYTRLTSRPAEFALE